MPGAALLAGGPLLPLGALAALAAWLIWIWRWSPPPRERWLLLLCGGVAALILGVTATQDLLRSRAQEPIRYRPCRRVPGLLGRARGERRASSRGPAAPAARSGGTARSVRQARSTGEGVTPSWIDAAAARRRSPTGRLGRSRAPARSRPTGRRRDPCGATRAPRCLRWLETAQTARRFLQSAASATAFVLRPLAGSDGSRFQLVCGESRSRRAVPPLLGGRLASGAGLRDEHRDRSGGERCGLAVGLWRPRARGGWQCRSCGRGNVVRCALPGCRRSFSPRAGRAPGERRGAAATAAGVPIGLGLVRSRRPARLRSRGPGRDGLEASLARSSRSRRWRSAASPSWVGVSRFPLPSSCCFSSGWRLQASAGSWPGVAAEERSRPLADSGWRRLGALCTLPGITLLARFWPAEALDLGADFTLAGAAGAARLGLAAALFGVLILAAQSAESAGAPGRLRLAFALPLILLAAAAHDHGLWALLPLAGGTWLAMRSLHWASGRTASGLTALLLLSVAISATAWETGYRLRSLAAAQRISRLAGAARTGAPGRRRRRGRVLLRCARPRGRGARGPAANGRGRPRLRALARLAAGAARCDLGAGRSSGRECHPRVSPTVCR